ncbi:MAG: chemotaxis protein, partial [Pseudomonadales bacterium]|nr:chemotaxis protein [Pseudomonadales bacterium]
MASDALETLNSLIVPLRERLLLLPNVAVAELVGYRLSEEASGGPDWFLGRTLWRDQPVPMVDLDLLMGEAAAIPQV